MLYDEHPDGQAPTRWGRLYDYLFRATADHADLTRAVGESLRAPYLR
jgi:hypothetical protein